MFVKWRFVMLMLLFIEEIFPNWKNILQILTRLLIFLEELFSVSVVLVLIVFAGEVDLACLTLK